MRSFIRQAFYVLITLIAFPFSILATSTLNLASFPSEFSIENHPFNSLHNQLVQVRGFWYPMTPEHGILSAHSGLKSCCLATTDKLHQQLIVKGQLRSFPVQRVITLEGIFKIEPLYNSQGELIQIYVLEQAREVQQATSYAIFLILFFFLVLLCLWRFFFRSHPT